MMDLKKYEYKSPSYEKVNRPNKYVISEELEKEKSRFYLEDGLWKSKAESKDEISLLFGGDLLCQENMLSGLAKKDGSYDFRLCFEYIRPVFRQADFVAGNLETPIFDEAPYRGEIITHEGPFFCNAPTEYLEALKYAGFDMLTTANNHTLDAGAEGLIATIENARKFDFIQTGTFDEKCDKYVIVDICGFRVGFTAFGTTYNLMQGNLTKKGRITLLNTYSENRATTILNEMKEKGVDYTVCFPHWGEEYTDKITPAQREMAETLTALGYDLIVGAHSHVVQRFEYINEKPVLFSLGNLISHMNLSKKAMDSQYPVLMNLTLKRTAGGIEPKIDFIPCRIFKKLGPIPFVVVPFTDQISYKTRTAEKLKEAQKEAVRLLKSDESVLNLSYPVDEEADAELTAFRNRSKSRVEALQSKESNKTLENAVEGAGRKVGFFKTLFSKADAETKIGKYKRVGDEMKLLCMDTAAAVVIIDREVEGAKVTAISNYYDGNDTARIVYVGKHVKTIEKKTFANFSALESVRLFGSLEVIEEEAFANCSSFTGIILPKSMKIIKKKAFANCGNLLSIKIPSSVTEISADAFSGSAKVTIYCEEGSYADSFAQKNHINVSYMPL